MNEVDGIRQSTALTYLAQARQRPNLTVKADTVAEVVLLANGRVAGIRTAAEEIESDRVILCAGTYGSPAILLRSGINNAGVGANLHDHPLLRLRFEADGEAATQPRQTLLTTDDLQIFPSGIENGELTVLVALLTPRSRGSVALSNGELEIDNGLLCEPDDRSSLLAGVDLARELVATKPLASHVGAELTADADLVAECLNVYQHPVGTCALGSVVDEAGNVFGVDGLSVVDASIMPTIPRANTNLPTLMLAEHLAEHLAVSRR
ncbi:hypothetical protein GCM10029976_096730 [Kribbella albertanoniae]